MGVSCARRSIATKKSTPEESDSSPAVLMASGLIAGGSIAGILIALSTAFLPTTSYYFPVRPDAEKVALKSPVDSPEQAKVAKALQRLTWPS